MNTTNTITLPAMTSVQVDVDWVNVRGRRTACTVEEVMVPVGLTDEAWKDAVEVAIYDELVGCHDLSVQTMDEDDQHALVTITESV